ncbi:MAG: TetR/AcrR family transcriptional regulator [Mycobacterium sp.]
MAAAFELFARDGYANTSIEEICQTAYVGNKALYDLFDSKEDCYVALLRQVSERIEEQVAQAMRESADADEEELVRRLLSAFAHTLVDDPRIAMVTFGVAAGISPRVEDQRRENRRWAASFIEGLWRHNHPSGGVDYHALAVATVGGLFETVTDSARGRSATTANIRRPDLRFDHVHVGRRGRNSRARQRLTASLQRGLDSCVPKVVAFP